MIEGKFIIRWVDGSHAAPPLSGSAFPDGLDADISGDVPVDRICSTALPYPSQGYGKYIIECTVCPLVVAVTTAGRVGDPKSIKFACGRMGQ